MTAADAAAVYAGLPKTISTSQLFARIDVVTDTPKFACDRIKPDDRVDQRADGRGLVQLAVRRCGVSKLGQQRTGDRRAARKLADLGIRFFKWVAHSLAPSSLTGTEQRKSSSAPGSASGVEDDTPGGESGCR